MTFRASRTRINWKERKQIVQMSAQRYRDSAANIAKAGLGPHSLFTGNYRESFVHQECRYVLGDARTENLSRANFDKLCDEAYAEHMRYVNSRVCDERGNMFGTRHLGA